MTPIVIRLSPFRKIRLRVLVRPPGLLAAAWLAAILMLEILGRRSTSDLFDGLGVAGIMLLVVITGVEHRRRRLRWVEYVANGARRLWEVTRQRAIRLGVDLRGVPPLPRAFPPILLASFGGIAAVFGVVGLFRNWFPQQGRDFLLSGSVTFYITLLGAVWVALVGVALLSLVFVGVCLHNWFVNAPRLQQPKRGLIEAGAFAAAFGALVTAALVLPVRVPVAALGLLLVVTLIAVGAPGAPRLELVWQRRGGGPVASTPWHRVVAAVAVMGATALGTLVIVALGDRLSGEVSTAMPITTFLGGSAAWTGAVAYFAWAWSFPLKAFMHRFRDPARFQPPQAVIECPSDRDTRWLHMLREAGFAIRLTARHGGYDDALCILLDAEARQLADSTHYELPISGTIRVNPTDLGHLEIHDAIRRSNEVERRRTLLKGIDELLRFATGRRFEHGHGFWIAPHLWFVTHMTRDTSEDDSWVVGPPYHRTLSLAARHHLHRVLNALQLDLIFVEDGVTFDQMRLVFRAVFDIYDLFGGNRAEEHHFDGVSGMRVVIHDFTMDRPFRDEDYPDVNYEEIGRARILHVFRDRGGTDDRPEVPIDADLLGAPALV